MVHDPKPAAAGRLRMPVRIGVALWVVGDQGPAGFTRAAAAGLDYVEIDMGGAGRGPDLSDDDALEAVIAGSRRSRLPVTALAVNRANDLGLMAPKASQEAAELARLLERAILVAGRLSVQRLILPGFRRSLVRSPEDARRTADLLRFAFDRVQGAGIELSYESALDAPTTLDLFRAVGRPAMTLQFDTGNPVICGHDASLMWPRLAAIASSQVHVKDVPGSPDVGDVPLAHGRANLSRVFAAFVGQAQPAAFTLEGNYRQDADHRIRRDLSRLKALLA